VLVEFIFYNNIVGLVLLHSMNTKVLELTSICITKTLALLASNTHRYKLALCVAKLLKACPNSP
jgi:hypothetical protein